MIGTQTLAQAHPTARFAPLSSHPLFTPALTVWSAAMLGLPVLAISGASLESWVMASRIDLILPAAAPPLGTTARLLLALGFALVGAGAGWLAARQLRPVSVRDGDEIALRPRDRHPDAPARRPISAHAELGDEGLGSASSPRDLFADDLSAYRTLPEDTPRHGGFLYEQAAPSPFAAQPYAEPVQPAAWMSPIPAQPTPAQPTPVQPTVAAMAQPEPAPAPRQHEADPYDMPDIDFAGLDAAPYAPYPSPLAASAQQGDTNDHAAEPAGPASTVASQPEAVEDDWHALPPVISHADLPSAPVRGLAPVISIGPVAAPALRAVEKAAPAEPPALIGATPVQPRASASERIAQAALGDLSHVELIERLAMAIHSRDKSATPVAVNDAQDAAPAAASPEENTAPGGTQASLRSALAGLREVK